MSASPKSKRPTPPKGTARNGAQPGDTKPSAGAAVHALRFRDGKPVLAVAERVEQAEDRIDALITDVRDLSEAFGKHAAASEERGERTDAALLELTAITSDVRNELRALARVVGGDVDTRASIHDMTAEELMRLESNGLRAQMRAVMATLATTKRTGLAAAGLGGVLSIEMIVRIILEILR